MVTATLSTGEVIQGKVYPDYLHDQVGLVGKCFDFEAACKQCAVAPAHSRYGIFALKKP